MEDPFGNDAVDLPITAIFNGLIQWVNEQRKIHQVPHPPPPALVPIAIYGQVQIRTRRFKKENGVFLHHPKGCREPESYLPSMKKVIPNPNPIAR